MEKIKLLLYCCKNGKKLVDTSRYDFDFPNQKMSWQNLNDKIVAECDYEVEEIKAIERWDYSNTFYSTRYLNEGELLEESCLTYEELDNYLKGKNGYAIYIKNLNIFDEPKSIQDYSKNENPYYYIENAPQNMMYAYDVKSFNNFEKKVLISIHPEWLCKILNGEKTIEVRKRVLRRMI